MQPSLLDKQRTFQFLVIFQTKQVYLDMSLSDTVHDLEFRLECLRRHPVVYPGDRCGIGFGDGFVIFSFNGIIERVAASVFRKALVQYDKSLLYCQDIVRFFHLVHFIGNGNPYVVRGCRFQRLGKGGLTER